MIVSSASQVSKMNTPTTQGEVMKTAPVTHSEWAKEIDQAARENRLYHFNGGQAYIQVGGQLLIVDMSMKPVQHVYYNDGFAANYFATYSPLSASKHIAENPLSEFYSDKLVG